MDLGIFIPIANNGWIMSAHSPQFMPSFHLNRTIAAKAEAYGFNFLLSMVKLWGFGGPTEFWDHSVTAWRGQRAMHAAGEKCLWRRFRDCLKPSRSPPGWDNGPCAH